ncbi:helix-turn-helix domain-containing protein [Amycolatopsis sp. H20-H5]|uniref:helix-turn-helix domain-containing protein n=1 Tax=Amycolatopsis sp. H20-H5 TaxID=3046309 RepID=UPI002DBE0434|nr:helix-turn-helix transcriptional regulator [Amycolatopsis sp. H20-H5]MEC3978136.1 helix-turn-helix transcriptional regulator [Amycolatopsis sp. H20-H5]
MRWTDDAVDQLYVTIGGNIKEARRDAKVTQADLGKRLRLTRSSIANIEAGRQRVMIHSIMQIAEELSVPTMRLLRVTGDTVEDRVVAELAGQPPGTQDFVQAALSQAVEAEKAQGVKVG